MMINMLFIGRNGRRRRKFYSHMESELPKWSFIFFQSVCVCAIVWKMVLAWMNILCVCSCAYYFNVEPQPHQHEDTLLPSVSVLIINYDILNICLTCFPPMTDWLLYFCGSYWKNREKLIIKCANLAHRYFTIRKKAEENVFLL